MIVVFIAPLWRNRINTRDKHLLQPPDFFPSANIGLDNRDVPFFFFLIIEELLYSLRNLFPYPRVE